LGKDAAENHLTFNNSETSELYKVLERGFNQMIHGGGRHLSFSSGGAEFSASHVDRHKLIRYLRL
jgi:hypothetical protein